MHWSAEPEHIDEVITRVQSMIAAKATLEIAKGMVAQPTGATIGEAARLLSAYASGHQVRLTETARALVNRDLLPAVVVDPQPQR
ncbi:ANTAR domain-containing protein [Streptomyces sp. NBC_01622]|uniref:ANTAR domain-containing protein n=1 Tax=Streptomyces sp. NBC_01622 TaxID=2975903 RepID=UPI003863EC55|nr:ANTAR domain-containing protein [Streptomyces sp. NBC_01622]